MKLFFQSPRFQLSSFIITIFLLFTQYTSKASILMGCDDYVCEDLTLFEPLPHLLQLEDLIGEFCEDLSFSPDSSNQSLLILSEGITAYTVYNLITGDSCTANVEMTCSVACPEEYSAFLELDEEAVQLQPSDFSLVSCYGDEVFLPPHEDGTFAEGEYELMFYSPTLDDTCSTELIVTKECYEITCNFWTRVYYNTTLSPQQILGTPCPDTSAYFIEILDENQEVLLSGNTVFLTESLEDSLDVRLTHIETGNNCTSRLRLYYDCLPNLIDTLFLDFTGIQFIAVPWDSFFTVPCQHDVSEGYAIGYGNQDGAIEILEDGTVVFKNTVKDSRILFSDISVPNSEGGTVIFKNLSLSRLEGLVFQDLEGDCEGDTLLDLGVKNMLVYAIGESDTFFNYSGDNGIYSFDLPEFYTYDIGLVEFNNFWDYCINDSPIFIDEKMETVDVGLSIDSLCSNLVSYMAIPRFRRCFDNTIYIDYCNLGSDTAYDVTLDFYFDEGLEIDADLYGFTVVDANHYQLEIGTLAPLECGELNVIAFVDCDLDLGVELCVEIELGPIPDCNDSEEWSGAALDVKGICEGDSVRFIISNIGEADMTQPREFIVIEDDIMIIQDNTNLPQGEFIEITVPANGSTYRLISDQEPFHPYTEQVSALVKECAENAEEISTGFVNSFVLDELAPYISIECQPVIASYDPNDKAVTPSGVYENNVIQGDEELEYMIRFENTGTDTAFNIFISDTLNPNLDLLTFRLVGSSHPVIVDYPTNGRLFFRFLNIELPDTSVNKLGAQGFVKYTIRPKSNLPLETKIHNTANIFFDFNSPIKTNTVDLQVGEILSTGLNELPDLKSDFVSPNPASAILNVHSEFDRFAISDINGSTIMTGGPVSQIGIEALLSGIYIIQIYENDVLVGVDRFVKMEKE